jgi:hypothetical protein
MISCPVRQPPSAGEGEYRVEGIEPIAAPSVAGIRTARLEEAPELSELCVRSKAVWGYDETFMALTRAALEVRPEDIDAGDVWVATAADGSIAGMVALGPSDQPRTPWPRQSGGAPGG